MDDYISRQQAIDAVRKLYIQPPKITNDISYDTAIDQAHDALVNLPSAQPRGKWIYHIDDLFPAESTMECNQCHAEQPLICDDEFCPHCGAKMEVTE